MKITTPIQWTLLLVLAMAGCAKVELMPEVQFPLLPLAAGNRWVYVDSFFTTTSLPSNDTFVAEVSYLATRPRWVDRFVKTDKPGKTLERLQGWEILNSYADGPQIVVAIGDTLFSDAINFYFNGHPYDNCAGIRGAVDQQPAYIATNGFAGIHAAMFGSGVVRDSLPYLPVFHDLPTCMPGLAPNGVQEIEFQVPFFALVATDSLVQLTTEAGTFTCHDFGSQWWAEGVGMVQSYHEGEAVFNDQQQIQRTGSIQWKRSLKSYQLY